MKWTRAVWHLETLAQTCADMITKPTSIFPLRVEELWAFGDVLGAQRDLDAVAVALVVDRPVEAIPWLDEPSGAQHWSNATRLAKSPVIARWRSKHAPVWNHRIDRPVLLWNADDGIRQDALEALRAGRGSEIRPVAAPRTGVPGSGGRRARGEPGRARGADPALRGPPLQAGETRTGGRCALAGQRRISGCGGFGTGTGPRLSPTSRHALGGPRASGRAVRPRSRSPWLECHHVDARTDEVVA